MQNISLDSCSRWLSITSGGILAWLQRKLRVRKFSRWEHGLSAQSCPLWVSKVRRGYPAFTSSVIYFPTTPVGAQFMSSSVQLSSVAKSCPSLCDPMNHSTPGLPVHHHLPGFTQTHVRWVCDAIQPSHPLLSPSPPAPNPSQHQSLFQWLNSSHEVVKVLQFQL